MISIQVQRKKGVSFEKIGIGLFSLYILTSYIANGVLLPSQLNSYALYLFLGFSILKMFFHKTLVIKPITVWQLVFMGISLISMMYSPEKSILSGAFYALIINFVLVLLLSQYNLTENTVQAILWTFSTSGLILVLLMAVTGNLTDIYGRLGTELVGNANALASMLMISSICGLWLFVYGTNRKIKKILLLLCVVADYVGLFLSGGRKYIVIPMIFLYLLFLFKQDKKGRNHIVKYTVIIIIAAVVMLYLIMNVPAFYNSLGVRLESFLSFMNGDLGNADYSAIVRSEMIKGGIQKWLESPIWGYGFNSFKYYNQTLTGNFYYSHNNFVELLYNTGLLGFIAYYYLYARILVASVRKKGACKLQHKAFIVAFTISLLVYEYTQVDYTDTMIVIMLLLAHSMVELHREVMKCNEE